jgi:hypothetical protein
MSQRKTSLWIEALKEYNKDSPSWCLPRKGSEGYNKVKVIMNRLKSGKPAEIKPDLTKLKPKPKDFLSSIPFLKPTAPDLSLLKPKLKPKPKK